MFTEKLEKKTGMYEPSRNLPIEIYQQIYAPDEKLRSFVKFFFEVSIQFSRTSL